MTMTVATIAKRLLMLGFDITNNAANFLSAIGAAPVATKGVTAYRNRLPLVASGTVNFDIPVDPLTANEIQPPIEMHIEHTSYAGTFGNAQYGKYLVKIGHDGTNNTAVGSLIDTVSNGIPTGFDPATAVAFSMLNASTLRVTITGGASVGSAGSNPNVWVTAHRLGSYSWNTDPLVTTARI